MVLEVFWAQMCTMEVLYIGVHSSGNSSLEFLELEPHVYLLRRIPMVSVLSSMQVYGLAQWSMPYRGGLSDAQAMREVPWRNGCSQVAVRRVQAGHIITRN